MFYFDNTLLLNITFLLSILFIQYQIIEDKKTGDDNELKHLKLNDDSLSKKNITELNSKFEILTGFGKHEGIHRSETKGSSEKVKKSKKTSKSKKKHSKTTTKKRPSKNQIINAMPKNISTIRLKKKVYDEINKFRGKYLKAPFKIGPKLEKRVQDYTDRFAKGDPKITHYKCTLDQIHYYCLLEGKFNPMKTWLKGANLLTLDYRDNLDKEILDLEVTRLLWTSTKYMGCGVSKNNYAVFVFCRFYPRGNIRGKYKENVFDFEDKVMNS